MSPQLFACVSVTQLCLLLPAMSEGDKESKAAGDQAMAIATKVAAGIEKLKEKYPLRLKNFSTEKHLRRIGVNGGFAPGTLAAWEGTGEIDYGDTSDIRARQYLVTEITEGAKLAGFAITEQSIKPVDEIGMDSVHLLAAKE